MDKQDKFANIIELVYQTVDKPYVWQQVLTEISDFSGSTHSFLTERKGVHGEPVSFYDSGFSTDYFDKYGEYFYQVDIWSQNLAFFKPNQFHESHKVCDDSQFLNSEIYSEFAKPEGIRHSIGLFLGDPFSELTTEMAFMRSNGQPHYEKETVRQVNRFIPHIQQVQNLTRRLYTLEKRNHTVESLLDQLDEAIFLCNKQLQVEYCNQQGQTLLDTSMLFTGKKSRLCFRDDNYSELFRSFAYEVMDIRNTQNRFVKRNMLVTDKKQFFLVSISPWKYSNNLILSEHPEFGIKISLLPVDSRQLPTIEDMALMFGLTNAEASVLKLLCLGNTLEAIAFQRQTNVKTTRQQIKSCIQKLNVSRQVELVIKVLGRCLI